MQDGGSAKEIFSELLGLSFVKYGARGLSKVNMSGSAVFRLSFGATATH